MIEIETLSQLVECNPATGLLRWKVKPRHLAVDERAQKSWNARNAGKPALTCKDSGGYLHGTVCGKNVLAHRVVWALATGSWPDGRIDHINGDITDNRIANLRVVSALENARNRKRSKANKSGRTGVRNVGGSWLASISDGSGSERHLGTFTSFEAACEARAEAERQVGFHENHGRVCAGEFPK